MYVPTWIADTMLVQKIKINVFESVIKKLFFNKINFLIFCSTFDELQHFLRLHIMNLPTNQNQNQNYQKNLMLKWVSWQFFVLFLVFRLFQMFPELSDLGFVFSEKNYVKMSIMSIFVFFRFSGLSRISQNFLTTESCSA